jgi:hypothetical protein
LERWGAIKKAFVMMTGTGGFKDAEDVLLIQEVLNSDDQQTGMGLWNPAFFKVRGTWESSGVPNIELAMMQLIHSRKALETDPIAYMQELQNSQLLWKRCLPSKDPTYSTKIKLPSSSPS